MNSLGMACNFWREPLMIGGLFENAAPFFDDLLFVSTPPVGKDHDEETCDIIRKFGARLELGSLELGFGVVRTQLIHKSTTEFVMIMDADERVLDNTKVLDCIGNEKYPHSLDPKNSVAVLDVSYTHGRYLKNVVNGAGEDYDAVRMCRRAWMDFTYTRPAQCWKSEADWQCRLVRNREYFGYDPNIKIHERIRDFRTGGEPRMFKVDDPHRGLFVEHFTIPAKKLDPKKNTQDVETYNALDEGVSTRMWLDHYPKA